MIKKIKHILFLFTLWLPMFTLAAPSWQIITAKSSLTFTAIQNNAPVTGEFKSFTGDIKFDPKELNQSAVRIVVDIGSVTTSYADVANTLKTSDWFDVKSFPQAIFQANSFTKTGNNSYQANGTLTLRDKTLPITLIFVLEKYSDTEALATGTTIFKRTQFGVGKGDWANTNEIKDDVKVNFTITATKK